MTDRIYGRENQPVSSVEWVDRDDLHANDYNPNQQADPEHDLLKVSLLENGWTQPIVVRENDEIVDGYHRWLASGDPEVYALTGGLVPVVRLPAHLTREQQMAATIRHNRARGVHGVKPMIQIVRHLADTLSPDELERLLGMEPEEIDRMLDSAGMPTRAGGVDFNKAWVPTANRREATTFDAGED